VLTLSHESILCLRSQFFGLWRPELSIPAHNISGDHEGTPLLDQGQYDWVPNQQCLPKVWLWASGTLLDTLAGGNPLLRTSSATSPVSLCFCLPEGLSQHSIGLRLLANFGLTEILALGVLSASSLWVETKPGVDLDTPMLEEACLVLAPGILLLPPPVGTHFCWR
jgi:hypothetical protein